jgi:hypothetical protein
LGILDRFGSMRLDAIEAPQLRAHVAELQERKVQPRGPANFVRTVLRAAIDCGALATMPAFPRVARQGRKVADAPSDAEVSAMLASAHDWLRAARCELSRSATWT